MNSAMLSIRVFISFCWVFFFMHSCNSVSEKRAVDYQAMPQELNANAVSWIFSYLDGQIADSMLGDPDFLMKKKELVREIYADRPGGLYWSVQDSLNPAADSLLRFIRSARLFGLFPEDYHFDLLEKVVGSDSSMRTGKADFYDPVWRGRADLLMTSAFVQLVHDVKLGRLPSDSISLRQDSVISPSFFRESMARVLFSGSIDSLMLSIEPGIWAYQDLKAGIGKFLESADFREFTNVPIPASGKDLFNRSLQKRLFEQGFIAFDSVRADSVQLALAVKGFQQDAGLAVDGIAGEATVRMLNLSDKKKFVRLALSLDKYKLLGNKMPTRYVWVNACSNMLYIIENNAIRFSTRVICGKPGTRTPLLNSAISMIVIYPQWVPPQSIVRSEILPAVKKNPGYLARKGFSLLDSKGEVVDPFTVDWTKYRYGAPYRIVQGSGDANALGVIKFHFDNPYAVYLHDTNQRGFFSRPNRSLSHGCVRVQDWAALANYIIQTDSALSDMRHISRTDSVRTWLAMRQRKSITIKNKVPVFIRYISAEGKEGKLFMYDDVYREDEFLHQLYFSGK